MLFCTVLFAFDMVLSRKGRKGEYSIRKRRRGRGGGGEEEGKRIRGRGGWEEEEGKRRRWREKGERRRGGGGDDSSVQRSVLGIIDSAWVIWI